MKATDELVNAKAHTFVRPEEGGIYEFRIKAKNALGVGLPSDSSEAVIIKKTKCKYCLDFAKAQYTVVTGVENLEKNNWLWV